jgi:hypothetical protein
VIDKLVTFTYEVQPLEEGWYAVMRADGKTLKFWGPFLNQEQATVEAVRRSKETEHMSVKS